MVLILLKNEVILFLNKHNYLSLLISESICRFFNKKNLFYDDMIIYLLLYDNLIEFRPPHVFKLNQM